MISAFLIKHLNVSRAAATVIKYGLFTAAVSGLVWGFADHYYDKGVSDCKATQAKSDSVVTAIVPDVQLELTESKTERDTERTEIIKTYNTGLTRADLKLAREEGAAEGARDGRKEVYAELRQNGGCLAIAYEPRDRLFNAARAQQQRFIQSGVGSYEATEADAKLPIGGREDNAISEGLAGKYPNPD